MRAALVRQPDATDPVGAVEGAHIEAPEAPAGWVAVDVRAASLNTHDIWLLRGAGVRPETLPLVLGSDAAGTSDGREVIVHAVLPDQPDSLTPGTILLCDGGFGTLATRTYVPADPKPERRPA